MIENVSITAVHCLPGASAGLAEKTALVRLEVKGDANAWAQHCQPALSELRTVLPTQVDQWRLGSPQAFGDWVVGLTVAILQEAREPVWRGAVVRVNPSDSTTELALPYVREGALRGALQWALRWLLCWGNPNALPTLREDLVAAYRPWLEAAQAGGLSPNTWRFAMAAHARAWPLQVDGNTLLIGWGAHRQRMESSLTGETPHLAARIAGDKFWTSTLLYGAGLPVPPAAKVSHWEGALQMAHQLGWPVVVKPSNQEQGTGVVTGIQDEAMLRRAFEEADRHSPGAVLVERHIPGEDHRLLVVQGRLLMATRRIPGGVTGDGQHTVEQLVAAVNADPRRGSHKRSLLMRLQLDAEALSCLAAQQLAPSSVPDHGRFVRLRRTANISTGGTAVDVTALIHPDNRLLAERAARLVGLDIAGVDFLCPDIRRSWHEVGGAICEVNAQPGFRPHWLSDPQRDINGEILDLLFAKVPPRIPTAAIAGTNGKSTTARMLHHIWQTAGKVTGVCTTQGVWIGEACLTTQNLSGQPGARLLLNDPMVEAAVLELPRKGLLRFGHPCDRYDVAALLNVQDDHIGVDGIATLEAMAALKAEVLERAQEAIVVNADDPLCLQVRHRAKALQHILVAREASNPAVTDHRKAGGSAVVIAAREGQPWIVLAAGAMATHLMPLHDIPATMHGLLRFNESNALFAVALAWAQGVPLDTIRQAMAGFHNSPAQNPGRYNFIQGLPFQVLVDYGHNPQGVCELFRIAARTPVAGRRLLVSLTGNRFRHHLQAQIPPMLATFDSIYLSQDEAYFQKNAHGFGTEDPLGTMLETARALIEPQLRPGQQLTLGRHDRTVLEQGLASARPGDLLVLIAEPHEALPLVERYRHRLVAAQPPHGT